MKRSTKIVTVIFLTFGIVGGAIAFGKHKYSDPEARANHVVGYISEELKLDSGQEEALMALKDSMLEARTAMKERAPEARDEVRAMIAADTFDQTKALQMLNNKTMMVNDAAPEIVSALGNFLDSLNPEQKAEVLEFMDRKAERHSRWRHH